MKLALCALLFAVTLQTVSAVSQLCLNSDNEINKIKVDGVNLTPSLKNKDNMKHCGCIDLPPNAGVIFIEAANKKGPDGIMACNSGKPRILKDWVCEPIRRLKKGRKYWQKRKTNVCKRFQRCQEARTGSLPCNPAKASSRCFWSKIPGETVRCRLKQCADGCKKCDSAGPGRCDSGSCKLGSSVSELSGKTSCKRVCRLDVRAWVMSGDAANGYIRVTDQNSHSVDSWLVQTDGHYLATVDMSTCTITNKHNEIWGGTDNLTPIFNAWNSVVDGVPFKNVIGIELGVGTGSGAFAPYIAITKLGNGLATPLFGGDTNADRFTATLTGVQNGDITFSQIQLI